MAEIQQIIEGRDVSSRESAPIIKCLLYDEFNQWINSIELKLYYNFLGKST